MSAMNKTSMNKTTIIGILLWATVIAVVAQAAKAQETPTEYQQVLKIVGKTGDYKSNGLKINVPRNDLHVKIAGYALHNHFFWEDPRVFFMHIHGHGKAVDLANQIKPALDLIGQAKPSESGGHGASTAAKQGTLDTDRIAKIVGHAGEQNGPVYKITVGRDDLDVKEMGATINARMGLNTWAAYVGSNDDAAVAGDVAMLDTEETPTLKALPSHGLAPE